MLAEEQTIMLQEKQRAGGMKPRSATYGSGPEVYQDRAKMQASISADEKTDDEIQAYWRLSRTMGEDKLSQRLAAISDMWYTKIRDYQGDQVIWELTKSRYTLDEIEGMVDGAYSAMYGEGTGRYGRAEKIENFRVDAAKKYGMNTPTFDAMNEVFKAQEAGDIPKDPLTGTLILSLLIPGVNAVTGASLAARGGLMALRVAQLGGKLSVAMQGISELKMSYDEKRMAKASTEAGQATLTQTYATEAAASPFGAVSPIGTLTSFNEPSVYAEKQKMREDLMGLASAAQTPEDREGMKQYLGTLQEAGIGADLENTGELTWEWIAKIIDGSKELTRLVIEEQRAAVEDGDADYWMKIDGNPNGEEWKLALNRRAQRLLENERFAEENPDRYKFWQESGVPTTKLGLDAFGRKLASNGILQTMYGSLLQGAWIVGQTTMAAGAAINLDARQRHNPKYQSALDDAWDFFSSQPFGGGGPNEFWTKIPDDRNETFMRWAVSPDGYLKDNADAVAYVKALDDLQVQMIQERYSADYLLTMGYLMDMDYDKVAKFGQDHPDVVRAFTTGVDLVTAYINPIGRVRRLAVKGAVKPTQGAWNSSDRAASTVDTVANHAYNKNNGLAASYMKGAGAKAVLDKVYRIRQSKKSGPVIDPRSQIVKDMATEFVDAAEAMQYKKVAKILDKAPDEFVDSLVNKVNTIANEVNAGPVPAGFRDKVIGSIAKDIAARQTKNGDVYSKANLAKRLDPYLGKAYVAGKDIFPYLRDSSLSRPNRLMEFMQQSAADITNPVLKGFLTRLYAPAVRGPLSQVEWEGNATVDRFYDAALFVSKLDATWANSMRNRLVATKTRAGYQRLQAELDAKYTENYTGVMPNPQTKMDKMASWMGKDTETGGQALAPDPSVAAFDAEGGPVLLGQYVPKGKLKGMTRQAVPDTSYQAYTFNLHRPALWAPYKMPKNADAFAKASIIARNLVLRAPVAAAHRFSTPLRQYTVAMGALLLFQKHALTDTSRTLLEVGPVPLAKAFGIAPISGKGKTFVPKFKSFMARNVTKILNELPPAIRDEVLMIKARAHSSEAQWYSSSHKTNYKPKTIRDRDTGKVIDPDGSANALRRLTQGEAFKAYARDGREGVEAWLATSKGKKFLAESDWYNHYASTARDAEIPVDKAALLEKVKEDYLDAIVDKEFSRLDSALPNIMPHLKSAALNETPLDIDTIKDLINRNPFDNAVISSPISQFASNNLAGTIVGKAMLANKFNRDVVFDTYFTRTYTKLRKQNPDISPEDAAQSAATVAEMQVARIHFDLANAASIEARHRWAAWFATKHRLFGTYVIKTALERPTVAAAAVEIMDWLAERNAEDVSEFDKYDMVLDLGPIGTFSLNVAPLFWFSEYPLESTALTMLEKGAGEVIRTTPLGDAVEGTWAERFTRAAPQPFGSNLTRADAVILTYYDVLVKGGGLKGFQSSDELNVWLNGMPVDKRNRWNKLINTRRAIAKAEGQEMTDVQAYNVVRWATVLDETNKAFKFYSGALYNDNLPEGLFGAKPKALMDLQAKLRDLAEITDPEEARQFIADNEDVAAMLNSTMNPSEKMELDEAFRVFNQIKADHKMAVDEAMGKGLPYFLDNYKQLEQEWADAREQMVESNPIFAKYYSGSKTEEFYKAIGVLTPFVPPDSVWETGRARTSIEIRKESERLSGPESDFAMVLRDLGMTKGDDASMLYQLLYEEMVVSPLSQFTGQDPYDLVPNTANTIARFLSRGGEAGVFQSDEFLTLIKDQSMRAWLSKGITSSANANAEQPFMAFLSDSQLDKMGYARDPATLDGWRQWAIADWQWQTWVAESGINKTTKAAQDMRASIMQPLISELRATNPGWLAEYEFSQLRLDQRLVRFGVGSGDTQTDVGMREFLGLVSDYRADLDQVINPSTKKPGVTPGAGAASETAYKYIQRVAELAHDNKDWWAVFHNTFSMSKFGLLPKWARQDPALLFLFDNDTWSEDQLGPEANWL
jgi:hypothetical protein